MFPAINVDRIWSPIFKKISFVFWSQKWDYQTKRLFLLIHIMHNSNHNSNELNFLHFLMNFISEYLLCIIIPFNKSWDIWEFFCEKLHENPIASENDIWKICLFCHFAVLERKNVPHSYLFSLIERVTLTTLQNLAPALT